MTQDLLKGRSSFIGVEKEKPQQLWGIWQHIYGTSCFMYLWHLLLSLHLPLVPLLSLLFSYLTAPSYAGLQQAGAKSSATWEARGASPMKKAHQEGLTASTKVAKVQ